MADRKRRRLTEEGHSLSKSELKAKHLFVIAVEAIMLELDAESVGRIADHIGEHGTDGDGGVLEDAAVVECLRVLVDAMGRRS